MPINPYPGKHRTEVGKFQPVQFASEGARLAGRLYRPGGVRLAPVVVMAHGFSATVTMTIDRYAEIFQQAGLAALLFDHRNFGASGGEPRHQINSWLQARGYRDAMSYAAAVQGLDGDRIALWGDSLSGAAVLVVAGVDERVAAVVVQVPATGKQPAPKDPDGARYAALRDTLLYGEIHGDAQSTIGPLPVVSADQLLAPSLLRPIQAYRWFIEYGGRFGSGWANRATMVVPRTRAPFHAGIVAGHIRCPVLMQISPADEMPGANPAIARMVFNAISAPKQLIAIDGGHFGLLYHPSRYFDDASAAQRDFLLDALT